MERRRLLAGAGPLLCLFENNRGECLCVSADQADKTDIRYFESRKCGLTLFLDDNLAVIFRRKHLLKVCVKLEKMWWSWNPGKLTKSFAVWRLLTMQLLRVMADLRKLYKSSQSQGQFCSTALVISTFYGKILFTTRAILQILPQFCDNLHSKEKIFLHHFFYAILWDQKLRIMNFWKKPKLTCLIYLKYRFITTHTHTSSLIITHPLTSLHSPFGSLSLFFLNKTSKNRLLCYFYFSLHHLRKEQKEIFCIKLELIIFKDF